MNRWHPWMVAAVTALGAPVAARAEPGRPTLLLIGTYHMANPGRDVANLDADDVLAPRRQREIEQVVERLSAFKPTRVAVEREASAQAALDARYRDCRPGGVALGRGEDEQIGFRLARRAGLERVDAVDWNQLPPVDLATLDYEAFAARQGQEATLAGIRARARARVARTEAVLRAGTILDALRHLNGPEQVREDRRAYFAYLRLNAGQEYPGASWVQYWYGRNLKILANLMRLPAGPGDRIAVVIGAGHASLLRLLAEESGAFRVVDPLDLLGPSARPGERPPAPAGE